jgi:superfamily II DNA/RNA helicase
MMKILRKFASFQPDKGNPLAEANRLRQFVFTGATIPKAIATDGKSGLPHSGLAGDNALGVISEWFGGAIKHVRTESCHQISRLVDQQWIDLEGASIPTSAKVAEEYELNLLVDIVKRSLDTLGHKSILIFAESKKSVDRICDVLK